jgi:hypothetical protein
MIYAEPSVLAKMMILHQCGWGGADGDRHIGYIAEGMVYPGRVRGTIVVCPDYVRLLRRNGTSKIIWRTGTVEV